MVTRNTHHSSLHLWKAGFLALISLFGYTSLNGDVEKKPLNVVFIAVDDLRPAIGAYGDRVAQTPSMDRLAHDSRIFLHHYVQSAVCTASRAAMLSGKRIRDLTIWNKLRKQPEPEDPVSWAHHLHRNGYKTICLGKVSHLPGGVIDPEQTTHEIPFSWDEAFGPVGKWKDPWGAFFGYSDGSVREYGYGRNKTDTAPYERAEVDDDGYADGLIAQEAVKRLEQLALEDNPFCLAVGFYKPHLPHNAPARYWDLYDSDKIPAPENSKPPQGVNPAYSLHPSFELTTHYAWPGGVGEITPAQAKMQRHAYYACVSYTDAQIGKVLDAIDRLGLSDNTMVILWGDHGWHLGEDGIFGKQTNFEVATRSPLMIRVPGMKHPGAATPALVETVDLFPTLADLCGLPSVKGLPGRSLRPWLEEPGLGTAAPSYSYFRRGREGYWGDTLRTDDFRLVHWRDYKSGKSLQIELYDHRKDPKETFNVANHPEYTAVLKRLMTELEDYSIRP